MRNTTDTGAFRRAVRRGRFGIETVVVAVMGCFLGCAAGLRADTPHVKLYAGHPLEVTVLLDIEMTDVEAAYAMVGFDMWSRRMPAADLRLHYGRVTHNDAVNGKPTLPTWIYVVRNNSQEEVSTICSRPHVIGCYTRERIFMDFGDTTAEQQTLIAAHELGHAFGLDHCGQFGIGASCGDTAMAVYVDEMRAPSETDRREFCRINGCDARH